MPVFNFTQISLIAIESHGMVDKFRSEFWAADDFDTNFVFGPFKFQHAAHGLITHIVHTDTCITAPLPLSHSGQVGIPHDQVGDGDGHYSLQTWSSVATCEIKEN